MYSAKSFTAFCILFGCVYFAQGEENGIKVFDRFINSGLGISLKADNGKYIRISWRQVHNYFSDEYVMEAKSNAKNRYSKIMVEKVDGDYVQLKSAEFDRYLCAWERGRYGNGEKIHLLGFKGDMSTTPMDCKFKVYQISANTVAFFSEKWKKFLGRVTRWEEQDGITWRENIEAYHGGIESYCKFEVSTGSITPVREEIVSVTWGKYQAPSSVNPIVVGRKERINGLSTPMTSTFSFEYTVQKTHETNWEHAWGVTAGISYSSTAAVEFGFASATATMMVSAEVNYNGKIGGNSGETKVMKLMQKDTAIIAPGKKVTIMFQVIKVDNAEIPFTATIKRTSEEGTVYITEKGTWKGVVVLNSYVITKQEDIKNPLLVQ